MESSIIVETLDAILSRYDIIDSVILAGQTETQFRFSKQDIPVYRQLFGEIYDTIKQSHPDIKMGNAFALEQVLGKNLQSVVTELSVGDFVAFSYLPVDALNDIVKTPDQAMAEMQQMLDMAGDNNIGIFELSWSTSDFVGGSESDQREFLAKTFEFYAENSQEIEFLTWYRQYDRPDGTCTVEAPQIGDSTVTVGSSSLGGTRHVAERLSHYICNAGLIDEDGNPKPAWIEFKRQLEMIR